MSGTGGSIGPAPLVHGFSAPEEDGQLLVLADAPNGEWTAVPLDMFLPEPGTYQLDAVIRSALNVPAGGSVHLNGRLFDTTAGQPVADSETMLSQISSPNGNFAKNESSPISVEHTVTAASVIRLEARRNGSEPNTAGIWSNLVGRTTLRYLKVGDP